MNPSLAIFRAVSRRPVIIACLTLLLVPAPGTIAAAAHREGQSSQSAMQPHSGISAPAAVRSLLQQQERAWNRGDIDSFMRGYKDSPETTFISTRVEHGYGEILQRYKRRYASRAAMGTLHFSGLHVQVLCAEYAVATGEFHLARTAAAGGDASGVFSLLFQKTASGWKIVLDHTTAS